MEFGKSRLSATAAGLIFFGWSHKHVFFANQRGKRFRILGNSEKRISYRCPRCGLVILD